MTFTSHETLVSIDVETDGRIPAINSMRSLGAAAFEIYESAPRLITTFSANLLPLPDATEDPETMSWWATQQVAWEACTRDARPAQEVMTRFDKWLRALRYPPFVAAYPVSWDFMFVFWYLARFATRQNEGDTREALAVPHSALDGRTLGFAHTKARSWRNFSKSQLRRFHDPKLPHTHLAVDDAIEQGVMMCNLWIETRTRVKARPWQDARDHSRRNQQ